MKKMIFGWMALLMLLTACTSQPANLNDDAQEEDVPAASDMMENSDQMEDELLDDALTLDEELEVHFDDLESEVVVDEEESVVNTEDSYVEVEVQLAPDLTATPATPEPEATPATPEPAVTPATPEPEIAPATPEVAPEVENLPATGAVLAISQQIDALLGAELMELDAQMMTDFYGMDTSLLVTYVSKVPMMNVHATEYFVAEVKEGNMDAVSAVLMARQASLASQWEHYLPEQYEMVQNYKLITSGNYILFVVAEQAEEIAAAFSATV